MMSYRRLVPLLAALLPIAGGCNSLLGIDHHQRAPLEGSDSGTDGGSGYSSDGEPTPDSGCGVDGAVSGLEDVNVVPGSTCGFTMPNPADAGLPNPATYTPQADGIRDNRTGLVWGAVNQFSQRKQMEAVGDCKQMGAGWRLPTRLELVSLVDFTKPGPTINAIFANTPSDKFWTSSHFLCDPSSAYDVGFDIGNTHPTNTQEMHLFRCVKGAPSRCLQKRYPDRGDALVHDVITGLTWQKTVPEAKTWSEAMAFCPGLGPGWRLPSLTELQTIVDETKGGQRDGITYPPIDEAAFPSTKAAYYWTSSPRAGAPDHAYYVAFIHGHADVDSTDMLTLNLVRCVRWDGFSTP
jgi:hypothetical protein